MQSACPKMSGLPRLSGTLVDLRLVMRRPTLLRGRSAHAARTLVLSGLRLGTRSGDQRRGLYVIRTPVNLAQTSDGMPRSINDRRCQQDTPLRWWRSTNALPVLVLLGRLGRPHLGQRV